MLTAACSHQHSAVLPRVLPPSIGVEGFQQLSIHSVIVAFRSRGLASFFMCSFNCFCLWRSISSHLSRHEINRCRCCRARSADPFAGNSNLDAPRTQSAELYCLYSVCCRASCIFLCRTVTCLSTLYALRRGVNLDKSGQMSRSCCGGGGAPGCI